MTGKAMRHPGAVARHGSPTRLHEGVMRVRMAAVLLLVALVLAMLFSPSAGATPAMASPAPPPGQASAR